MPKKQNKRSPPTISYQRVVERRVHYTQICYFHYRNYTNKNIIKNELMESPLLLIKWMIEWSRWLNDKLVDAVEERFCCECIMDCSCWHSLPLIIVPVGIAFHCYCNLLIGVAGITAHISHWHLMNHAVIYLETNRRNLVSQLFTIQHNFRSESESVY